VIKLHDRDDYFTTLEETAQDFIASMGFSRAMSEGKDFGKSLDEAQLSAICQNLEKKEDTNG
jgi:hypothetical protein